MVEKIYLDLVKYFALLVAAFIGTATVIYILRRKYTMPRPKVKKTESMPIPKLEDDLEDVEVDKIGEVPNPQAYEKDGYIVSFQTLENPRRYAFEIIVFGEEANFVPGKIKIIQE